MRRQILAGIGVLVTSTSLVGFANATLIVSGGGLVLVEQGGAIRPNNLAAGATPFALDEYGAGVHLIPHLNDQTFGNSKSWLGAGGTVMTNWGEKAFVGLSFGSELSVQSFAFGRDNLNQYSDRWSGQYVLQYTRAATVDVNTAETGDAMTGWVDLGTIEYQAADGSGLFTQPHKRHRFDFDPVNVTGIRLLVGSTATAIDELEFYADKYEFVPPPPPPVLQVGVPVIQDESQYAVGLNYNWGPISEPAPGDGNYRHANGPGQFTWQPGVAGENVKVEASWGVSPNHSLDVDYYFDPDGPGPLPEILLVENVRQDLLADQQTAGSVVWSGFFEIASGLTLTADSIFRVTGTAAAGGIAPEALSSGVWRITAVPEPGSAILLALGMAGVLARGRRRV